VKGVTLELLELDLPTQTLCPTTKNISLFAHGFQLFSSTYFKLHPLQLFPGAKHLLTPILCGQEECKISRPLLPFCLMLAGRTPLLCPHTRLGAVFPVVAAGLRGCVTCAVGVILCKSTPEFRPVSINLLS